MTWFKALLAGLLLALCPVVAYAQAPMIARVVAACGTVPVAYPAGSNQLVVQDVNGNFCTNASGGGGGGGAITIASGAVASGAYSAGSLSAGAGVDGWDLTQGAIGDAAATAGSTGSVSAKLRTLTGQLTGLPTTATSAGADAVSNTLTGLQTYSRLQMFNGTTWDRVLGNAGKSLQTTVYGASGTELFTSGNPGFVTGVGVSNNSSAASSTYSPVSGLGETTMSTCTAGNNCAFSMVAGTNLRSLRSDQATWAGTALGTPTNFGTTPGAVVVPGVNASLFMGTAAISATNGIYSNLLQGNAVISATNPIFATLAAAASGGGLVYHVLPGASDNHVVIKNGAGTAYSVQITNKHTAAQYIRLYDAGTGFNGCNSATNILWGSEVPPNDSGISMPVGAQGLGAAFTNGLSICYTGAYGDTDTTNATASVSVVNVGYK